MLPIRLGHATGIDGPGHFSFDFATVEEAHRGAPYYVSAVVVI
jgi:hypothetical protein